MPTRLTRVDAAALEAVAPVGKWLEQALGGADQRLYLAALSRLPDLIVSDIAALRLPAVLLTLGGGRWNGKPARSCGLSDGDVALVDALRSPSLHGKPTRSAISRGKILGVAAAAWLQMNGPMGVAEQLGVHHFPPPPPSMPDALPRPSGWFPHAAAVAWVSALASGQASPVADLATVIGPRHLYQRPDGGSMIPMTAIDALDQLVASGLAEVDGRLWTARMPDIGPAVKRA